MYMIRQYISTCKPVVKLDDAGLEFPKFPGTVGVLFSYVSVMVSSLMRWFLFLITTLRNILLLGQMAENLLTALKLRSVGRNHHKVRAISGVLGVLFLHSRYLSAQMYEAMVCRGFTGQYPMVKKLQIGAASCF